MPLVQNPYLALPACIQQMFAADVPDSPSIWLAGGGAVRAVLGVPNAGIWHSDWDLYCTGAGFALLCAVLGRTPERQAHRHERDYALYFDSQELLHIFVGEQFASPTQVYRFFDLSIVCVAISRGAVVFGPKALEDLQLGQFRYVRGPDHPIERDRVERYQQRGFKNLGRM